MVSRFRLTYSMILNLLRVEELRVEDMMKRSFAEFHMQKDAQERKREMEELEQKLQNVKELDCTFCSEDLKLYFKGCRELSELTRIVQVSFANALRQLSGERSWGIRVLRATHSRAQSPLQFMKGVDFC